MLCWGCKDLQASSSHKGFYCNMRFSVEHVFNLHSPLWTEFAQATCLQSTSKRSHTFQFVKQSAGTFLMHLKLNGQVIEEARQLGKSKQGIPHQTSFNRGEMLIKLAPTKLSGLNCNLKGQLCNQCVVKASWTTTPFARSRSQGDSCIF